MIPFVRALGRKSRLSLNTRRHTNIGLEPEPVEEVIEELSKEAKEKVKPKPSERYLKFKEKLRSNAPVLCVPKGIPHPAHEKEPLPPWPNNTNPYTGEIGGPRGPEPTRYGDWQSKGRVTDF
ncbi:succinate dehydrogenase assembly factor 4, mitochondrial [Drosophila innubila]|uniref:succinate dehydrogenase assembly factor 4, mitochondrial n=1 Tax=Drosophila innubila TaxID=198719 RepID=UPI00148C0C5A|nr:succinate dehydrogenase assembly factor 4, mitochondrial [Drosophila innubila]